ncbi:DUF4360 domain-containing protein [bacterium]|nr:DUF4360 domain-containing protein [bacterium]
MIKFKVLMFSVFFANSVFAAEFGKTTMGGFGCPKVEVAQIGLGNNVLPLKIDIEKPGEQDLARVACNLRVPVKLKKDEMLKIVSGGADYKVEFDKGGSASVSLYAGFGGKKETTSQASIVESNSSTIHIPKNESGCGKDVMLRINFDASISGKFKSSFKAQNLKFEIKTIKCN